MVKTNKKTPTKDLDCSQHFIIMKLDPYMMTLVLFQLCCLLRWQVIPQCKLHFLVIINLLISPIIHTSLSEATQH